MQLKQCYFELTIDNTTLPQRIDLQNGIYSVASFNQHIPATNTNDNTFLPYTEGNDTLVVIVQSNQRSIVTQGVERLLFFVSQATRLNYQAATSQLILSASSMETDVLVSAQCVFDAQYATEPNYYQTLNQTWQAEVTLSFRRVGGVWLERVYRGDYRLGGVFPAPSTTETGTSISDLLLVNGTTPLSFAPTQRSTAAYTPIRFMVNQAIISEAAQVVALSNVNTTAASGHVSVLGGVAPQYTSVAEAFTVFGSVLRYTPVSTAPVNTAFINVPISSTIKTTSLFLMFITARVNGASSQRYRLYLENIYGQQATEPILISPLTNRPQLLCIGTFPFTRPIAGSTAQFSFRFNVTANQTGGTLDIGSLMYADVSLDTMNVIFMPQNTGDLSEAGWVVENGLMYDRPFSSAYGSTSPYNTSPTTVIPKDFYGNSNVRLRGDTIRMTSMFCRGTQFNGNVTSVTAAAFRRMSYVRLP